MTAPTTRPPSATAGYAGRVLLLDLSSGTHEVETPDETEWRRYAGGAAMGVRQLLRDSPAGLDAFDPSALLMFWSSVVAGHPYVGLARFAVVAKSPLTGGVGEARVEGPYGHALKRSGFDGLVLRGRSERPVYLLVDDGEPSLHDAGELWGTDAVTATGLLKQRHGASAAVAVIGPAGEALVRFAGILTEWTHPAARMGMGAVMGSKNLKAVVLVGGQAPALHDEPDVRLLTEEYRARIAGNSLTASQYDPPGFGVWPMQGDPTGYAGGENYRTSSLPALARLDLDGFASALVSSSGHCPGCPNDCIKLFDNAVDRRAGGLDEELVAAFALGLGITDTGTLLDLAASCHAWGVDPVSLAFTLSFFCEAAAAGLVPSDMLPGDRPAPTFGDEAGLLATIEDVVCRRPGAQWLGEGVRRAAALLGPAAQRLAMEVKGLEMVSFDPRSSAGQALAFAVSPLGPRYEIVEHDIDFDPVDGYEHGLTQMRTLGVLDWQPMAGLDPDRVARTATLLDMWSGLDALNVCLFAGPPLRELGLREVARLVSAVTGWVTSDHEIFLWGQRRWTLMRLYNLREGIDASEDRLPSRFTTEAVDAGRHTGSVLDAATFARSVRAYYELAGWDSDGRPTDTTLARLGVTRPGP